MTDSKLILRTPKKEDKDFIMSSWLKNNWGNSDYFNKMPPDIYFKEYTIKINKILFNPETKVDICVLMDEPDQIIGYLVYREPCLHWIYVKKDYRGQGIANFLMNGKKIEVMTCLSKAGHAIAMKKKLVFNPFEGE